MLDVFLGSLLAWLARVIRSNVLFGAAVVAIVGALIAAGWFVLSR
jgi:hypothetical protein